MDGNGTLLESRFTAFVVRCRHVSDVHSRDLLRSIEGHIHDEVRRAECCKRPCELLQRVAFRATPGGSWVCDEFGSVEVFDRGEACDPGDNGFRSA